MEQGIAVPAEEEPTAVQTVDLFVATQQRYVKAFVLTERNQVYPAVGAMTVKNEGQRHG